MTSQGDRIRIDHVKTVTICRREKQTKEYNIMAVYMADNNKIVHKMFTNRL